MLLEVRCNVIFQFKDAIFSINSITILRYRNCLHNGIADVFPSQIGGVCTDDIYSGLLFAEFYPVIHDNNLGKKIYILCDRVTE